MKLLRRQFLHLAAGAALAPTLPRPASALDYPTRPVRLVIGFAPGGPADLVARLLSQRLSERLGQVFVIENRPGAGTTIATETVVLPPDGYTLLWTTSADAINATLYDRLNFSFVRDIAPVACIDLLPLVMEVTPSFPAKTVREFIAYAKANPGKINFASGGVGSTQHVAGELFNFMTGVDLVHVPYRGAALAVNDLLAGQVQVTFSPIPLSIGYIRAEKLRALAVTSAARSPALPDIPTVGEFVPGYEATASDGSVRRRAPRRKSSTSSTMRSMRRSPTRKSRRGWKTSAACQCRCRPPNSQNSLPKRPKSGGKWSASHTSSRVDTESIPTRAGPIEALAPRRSAAAAPISIVLTRKAERGPRRWRGSRQTLHRHIASKRAFCPLPFRPSSGATALDWVACRSDQTMPCLGVMRSTGNYSQYDRMRKLRSCAP